MDPISRKLSTLSKSMDPRCGSNTAHSIGNRISQFTVVDHPGIRALTASAKTLQNVDSNTAMPNSGSSQKPLY